jgi:hypothetical protein
MILKVCKRTENKNKITPKLGLSHCLSVVEASRGQIRNFSSKPGWIHRGGLSRQMVQMVVWGLISFRPIRRWERLTKISTMETSQLCGLHPTRSEFKGHRCWSKYSYCQFALISLVCKYQARLFNNWPGKLIYFPPLVSDSLAWQCQKPG